MNFNEEEKENIDDEKIIDAEFKENSDVEYIRGKPIYFTTSDVAHELSENESTIRFWCESFKSYLQLERKGRNRRFKNKNIEQLKFIQGLIRESNFSIKQVQEFLTKQETGVSIIEDNSQSDIQILVSTMSNLFEDRMGVVINEIQEQKEYIRVLENKIDLLSKSSEIVVTKIEEIDTNAQKREVERDIVLTNNLKESLNGRAVDNNDIKEKKKGLFKKIFG